MRQFKHQQHKLKRNVTQINQPMADEGVAILKHWTGVHNLVTFCMSLRCNLRWVLELSNLLSAMPVLRFLASQSLFQVRIFFLGLWDSHWGAVKLQINPAFFVFIFLPVLWKIFWFSSGLSRRCFTLSTDPTGTSSAMCCWQWNRCLPFFSEVKTLLL